MAGARASVDWSAISVAVWAKRLRWLAPPVAVVLAVSLLWPASSASAADPELPPGATSAPPEQPVGAVDPEGPASTEETQGRRGPGAPEPEPLPEGPKLLPPTDGSRSESGLQVATTPSREFAFAGAKAIQLPVEDPEARRATSTEYVNPDGSITVRAYNEVAFVPDPASPTGELVPVSTVLQRRERDGRYAPEAASDSSFAASTAAGAGLAQVRVARGVQIGFGLDGAAAVSADVSESTATYRSVMVDTDLVLRATAEGVKDELVLRSKAAPRTFTFPLSLSSGVSPLATGGGGIWFVDRSGSVVAEVPPPFMEDSSVDSRHGGPARSNAVSYAVLGDSESGWSLRLDIDPAWVQDTARVWPIMVDPYIAIRPENDDAFVSSRDYAGVNTSGFNDMTIGTYDSGGERSASYLHFNNAIATMEGKVITSAKVNLWNTWSWNCNPAAASVYRVTQPWNGASIGWPGPTYESTALATVSFAYGWTNCPTQNWGTWWLPVNRVQAWVDGTEPFYGLTVRASETSSQGWKRFWSANYSDFNKRPFMDFSYVDPVGASAVSPAMNATVATLTPTLWVNPNVNAGLLAKFKVCNGEDPQQLVHCTESGWTENTFTVPAGWIDAWSKPVWWAVQFSDEWGFASPWQGWFSFTPQVPQPPITSHLAGAPDGAEIAGVNPQVGNYATTISDAEIAVAGPALNATRTYNSQDPRTNGYFGAGWSTPWEQRLEFEPSAANPATVLVTLASGRQVRFGRNPGTPPTYSPPLGHNLDLVYNAPGPLWTLRDPSGVRREFGAAGQLTKLIDVDGRQQLYSYTSAGPAGSNLALNKPATGSTPCGPNEGPEKAVNGTTGGGVYDKWCSLVGTRWWQVDLGAPQSIASVRIKHAGAGSEPTSGNTRDFEIQTSLDATNWTSVVTVFGNGANVTTHEFAPRTARYVRLNITTPTQTSDPAARIYEVEVYAGSLTGANWLSTVTDSASGRALHVGWRGQQIATVSAAPGPLNLALNKPATGSTPCGPAEGPDKAVNGSTGTVYDKWCSLLGTRWWQVDLGFGQTVASVLIKHAGAGGESVQYNTRDFAVQTSLDGSSWTPAATVNGNAASVTTHEFAPRTARYVRLDVTTPTQTADPAARIYEVEVYASSVSGTGSPLTWAYTYTGGKLASVCTPLGPGSCTSFGYGATSHYRSEVLDDNPAAYWPLNGTSGSAVNLAAQTQGQYDGTYNSITAGTGALPGSPDASATFSAASNSRVTLPTGLINSTVHESIELWFKAASGSTGALFAEAHTNITTPATEYAPMAYVGTDGKLRGLLWNSNGVANIATSAARVDDNVWHHVVVTGAGNEQRVYLDGVQIGQILNRPINHLSMNHAWIGNGWAGPYWPGGPSAVQTFPFTGQIDEVAFYRYPLTTGQVESHYRSRAASTRLTTITEPGSFIATTVGYNHASGRVSTLTDRHGGTWTLSAPTLAGGGATQMTVSIQSGQRGPIAYTYDTIYDGRLLTRTEATKTRTWTYGEPGFVDAVTDENGNKTSYGHDDRGNITSTTTCRNAGSPSTGCNTEYFSYYLNSANLLDARNDVRTSSSDARSATPSDTTYRTSRTLDLSGRPLVITYPKPNGQATNPTESFTYTTGAGGVPAGLLATHTARNGGVTTHTYNTSGDRLTTTDPVGLVATNTYDQLGRLKTTALSATVAGQQVSYGTTTYTYNGLSQPLSITEPTVVNPITTVPHTKRTTFAYNNSGRPTSQAISDTTGGDPTRTTSFGYDPAGRLTSVTRPDTTVVTQTWNQAGDLAQTTLPSGLTLKYTYDFAHRLTATTAAGAAGRDAYNPANTADVLLESRSYDPAGRLASVQTSVTANNDLRTTSYVYYGDNLTKEIRRSLDSGGTLVVEQRVYDGAGNVTSLTTPGPTAAGTVTTSTYDSAGNLRTQALDPTGLNRVTTHTYRADSTISFTTATGAASPGRTEKVTYGYDLAGRVLTTTVDNTGGSPAALTTTLVRDPRGLVTRETDPSGIATNYAYDVAGNPLTETGASRTTWVNGVQSPGISPVTSYGHNTFGETTHLRDPNLGLATTAYDVMGRPTSVTQPMYTPPGGSAISATSSTSYNAQGLPATTTDALGHVTGYSYDVYGRLLTRTEPDPDGAGSKTAPVWTYKYLRSGETRETVDPVGAKTLATFNKLGLQITRTVSENGGTIFFTTTLGYDDAGNQTSSTTALNHARTTNYNTAHEATKVTDPTGRFTQTSYDLAGRIVSTVAGQSSTYANPVTTTGWDVAGREVSTSDCTASASGACATVLRTAATVYDAAGRVVQETSAAGRPTFFGYDTAGQLNTVTQRVDPANSATAVAVSLGYDAVGNRTRMVDGNGNATVYTYTPWNLPESTIEPSTPAHPSADDRTWTSVYDAAGRMVEQRLPGNVTRTSTYDNLDRLVGETGSGGTTTARVLDYDPLGRITFAASPAGDHTYAWTDRGLLASATGYGGTASYTYNAEANLTQRVDQSGTATFGYDNAGRQASVVDPLTATTATYTYDNAGRVASIGHGAGNSTRGYTYNNLGRVATDTVTAAGPVTPTSTSYVYDLDGLLTSKTTAGVNGAGLNSYGYDGLSRVTSWLSPAGDTTTYGYDGASNRTTVTTPAGGRTSAYDSRNRLVQTDGAGGPLDLYTYNPRGQLTGAVQDGQTRSYDYDAFERLTQVSGSALPTIDYGYDSHDRPAQRNGASFGYHDLSNNPVVNPGGAGETKLLRDPVGAALAAKTGTDPGTLLLDDPIHHDIVATTNPTTGAPSESAAYAPWGVFDATGPLPLGFQGGYTDPDTDLINAHARWYDPSLATFTSRDTSTLEPNPIAQANRYLYANGSPLNGRDPDGHYFVEDSSGRGQHGYGYISPSAPGGTATRTTGSPVSPTAGYTFVSESGSRITTEQVVSLSQGCEPNEFCGYFEDLADWEKTKVVHNLCTYGVTEYCTQDRDSDLMAEFLKEVLGIADAEKCAMEHDTSSCVWTGADIGLAIITGGISKVIHGVGKGAAFVVKHADDAGDAALEVGQHADDACPVLKLMSFAGDTPVLLADGSTRPIARIRPGDHVVSTDPDQGATARKPVTAVWVHEDRMIDLALAAGETITTTEDHPFWNATDQQWQRADQLEPGDQLFTSDRSEVTVEGLSWTTGHTGPAYNLTIADVHTYYVVAGSTAILVHNCGTAAQAWANKADFSDVGTLSAKYDAHATDFGISGNRNKATLAAFQNALIEHMTAPSTKIFRFNYRGQGPAVGFIDPATNKMVMLHADSGQFWTAYTLGDNQFARIIDKGYLW